MNPTTWPSVLRAHSLGDSAITIELARERSADLLARIHAVARTLRSANIAHVEDIVPAYLALTVFYDSLSVSYAAMAETLIAACEEMSATKGVTIPGREHRIPVKYDGVDLEYVATSTGLVVEEVISRHIARSYTVDLLGFVPGFAYLSELDPALRLPRRAQPRPRVAAGSVALAGAQTAVYPLDTPGGWHIIGTTQTVMFDPAREPSALLAPGDAVRFERVR